MNRNVLSKMHPVLKVGITALLLLVWSASCSSGPSQSPEKFIMDFIEKHISMTDLSLASYYVKSEQSGIKELVNSSIQSKKEKGILDSLKKAVYDFSKVNVNVLDQIEEYVDDEPTNFVRVEAKGPYTLTINDKTQAFVEDEIFILQTVRNKWKVTEKVNPWN